MTSSDASLDAQYTSRAPLRWTRRDWAALVLLALLVALFFWRILTPNLADRASFPPGDFSYQFWAFATFEVRELSSGRIPLWNPYTYAGAPFWADIQSAVLYPISLLTLLLSGPWGFSLFALEVEAVVHFWLVGMFTYLLVRRLTRHRGAALFAAITFTFGGYLTGYPSQQLAVLETVVWLPLLLYFTDQALLDRSSETPYLRSSLPNMLAASLVWAVILLAGHPQSTMFVFYTFILYVTFLILTSRRHPGSQSVQLPTNKLPSPHSPLPTPYSPLPTPYSLLATPLSIILIGLGLSAIAWLPGLEYMRLSVRAAGLYDKMASGFPLYDPVQMLLPGSVSFYSPLYVGVLPLLLGVWVALSLRQRETTFWGTLAVGALLLSFGGETFLYTPFYLLVPGFSIFRGQERAAVIVSFALAVLAGYGFKYLISDQQTSILRTNAKVSKSAYPQSPTSNLQLVVGWLLVGAVGLVVLFFYALNNAGWQDDSPFNFLLSRSVWLAILLALIWGVMKIVDWRLGTGGWGSRTSGKGSKSGNPYSLLPAPYSVVATCCLLLVTFDLFTVNWKTNIYPSLPEAQTTTPAVVQAIRQDASPDEIFRVYNEYRIYENYGVPYALEDAWGASPLRLARYDAIYRSLRMERLWELLNVKYVITWRQELYAPSEIIYQEAAGDDVTYVHRLSHVAPRAWLVYQVEVADDAAALLRLDAFDFDPAQVALMPPHTLVSIGGHPADDETGQVESIQRTPGSMALNVTTPADSLLMLSEVYYPGWQATVDDQTIPIVRADYTLRGVPIPAGEHRVEIFYRPVTFIWGAAISGGTLLAVAMAGIGRWLRRKSQRDNGKVSSISYPLRDGQTK